MNIKQLPFLFLGLGVILAAGFFMIFGHRTAEIEPGSPNASSTASSSSSTTDSPKPTANLLAVGDIMLGRFVETLWKEKGEDYPFVNIRESFASYDTVIANLEGPIPEEHVQTPLMGFDFSFASSTVKTLKRNGVDIVSLANNHTTNAGDAGFIATRKYLSAADIQYFGNPVRQTREGVLATEVNGVPLVLVGFNATFPSFDLDEAALLTKQVRKEFPDRFLLVFMHWGDEYQLVGNATQKQIAHSLIDDGADVIIGAHPHVVQHIEQYNGKIIFYSLGNFIFDQYFSKDVQEGLMVALHIDSANIHNPTFELLPIDIVRSQPKLMLDNKKTIWLTALAKRSDAALRPQIEAGALSLVQ